MPCIHGGKPGRQAQGKIQPVSRWYRNSRARPHHSLLIPSGKRRMALPGLTTVLAQQPLRARLTLVTYLVLSQLGEQEDLRQDILRRQLVRVPSLGVARRCKPPNGPRTPDAHDEGRANSQA